MEAKRSEERETARTGDIEDTSADFWIFFSEVDRAIDNLVKSGKMFNMPSRRESMPLGGAGRGAYPEFGKQSFLRPQRRVINTLRRVSHGRYV